MRSSRMLHAVATLVLFLPLAAQARPPTGESEVDRLALEQIKPALRACYRGNVGQAMGMRGSLQVRLQVSANGKVQRAVLVKSLTGMPKYRDACAMAEVRKARLAPGSARTFEHTFAWQEGKDPTDLPME